MAVYPVREDTLLVKRNLEKQDLENKKILEIGVGNAENSLYAAKKGAKVTATDIDNKAIKKAEKRFQKENLEAEIIQTSLFQDLTGKYDLIIFNPPYLKGPKDIGDENMWRGGEKGLETAEKYLEKTKNYLRPNGEAWVILSSRTSYTDLVNKYNLIQLEQKKLWFETIFLFKLE
jgi:release factor glutamine methyltransferase